MHHAHTPIEKLVLDKSYPRVPEPLPDGAAINYLIQNEGLLDLAQSIAEFGFSIYNSPIVEQIDNDLFKVRDGNRRVAALKILKNPNIIDSERDRKKVRKLVQNIEKPLGRTIPCDIPNNQSFISHMLEVNHLSNQRGAALRPWSAIQKAKHDLYNNKTSLAVFAVLALNEALKAKKVTQTQYNSFSLSTLTRVTGNQTFKELLDITSCNKRSDFLALTNDQKQKIIFIICDIVSKNIQARDIDRAQDVEAYLKKLFADEPTKPTLSEKFTGEKAEKRTLTLNTDQLAKKRKKPSSSRSNCRLFDRNTSGRLADTQIPKIEEILNELEALDLNKFPNAMCALLRIYLETFSKTLLEIPSTVDRGQHRYSGNLKSWLLSIAKKLSEEENERQRLSLSSYSAIQTALKDDQLVQLLNEAIHNEAFHINPTSLKSLWNNLLPMLKIGHELISNRKKLNYHA